VELGDPSDFYQSPLMQIGQEDGLEVIRVAKCVSVSHVLAAVCLEMCLVGPPAGNGFRLVERSRRWRRI